MMKVQNSSVLDTFSKLSKKRQKAVVMLFKDDKTIEEIAKKLNVTDRTIYKWKKAPEFIRAQQEYSISQLDHALPMAVKELLNLIKNSKSDMVKLQAIQTVFKRAGLFSDNGTPELDKARVRKANADAKLSEAKVKSLFGDKTEQEDKVAEMMGELHDIFKDEDSE